MFGTLPESWLRKDPFFRYEPDELPDCSLYG
jgi:hypothetical protein